MAIKDKFSSTGNENNGIISPLSLFEINDEFANTSNVSTAISTYRDQAESGSTDISWSDMFGKANFNTLKLVPGYADYFHQERDHRGSTTHYSNGASGFPPIPFGHQNESTRYNYASDTFPDNVPYSSYSNAAGTMVVQGPQSAAQADKNAMRIPGEENARVLSVTARLNNDSRFTNQLPINYPTGSIFYLWMVIQTLDRTPSTLSKPWSHVEITGHFLRRTLSVPDGFCTEEITLKFRRSDANTNYQNEITGFSNVAGVPTQDGIGQTYRVYSLPADVTHNIDYTNASIQADLANLESPFNEYDGSASSVTYGYNDRSTQFYWSLPSIDTAVQPGVPDLGRSNYSVDNMFNAALATYPAPPFRYYIHEGITHFRWGFSSTTNFKADNNNLDMAELTFLSKYDYDRSLTIRNSVTAATGVSTYDSNVLSYDVKFIEGP